MSFRQKNEENLIINKTSHNFHFQVVDICQSMFQYVLIGLLVMPMAKKKNEKNSDVILN